MSLGNFSRNRIDWNVENAMVASYYQQQAGTNFPGMYLLNNDVSGHKLAVLAICTFTTRPLNLFSVMPNVAVGGTAPAFVSPLVLGGVTISGSAVGFRTPTLGGLNPSTLLPMTGDQWLHLGGAPMWVIPPGSSLAIWNGVPFNIIVVPQVYVSVSIIWSYYDVARPVAARRAA